MSILSRTLFICEITKLPHQNRQPICYVPELAALVNIIQAKHQQTLSPALKKQFETIEKFNQQYGVGVFPQGIRRTKNFVEALYNELLKSNIPLPPNISELDLPFIIKNYQKVKQHTFNHEVKIHVERKHLSFFAKYLPWLGTMITFTLTMGLTISTFTSMLGWGWSITLLSIFGLSKFLTSYADISGGPERRMTLLGLWLDRLNSEHYKQFGKYSLPKIALISSVIGILACSSLLTWYGAWHLIRCMQGMSYLPNMIAVTLAGIFAWSSAGASFGRIYQDLYQLLFHYFSAHFTLDSFNEHEKLDMQKLQQHFSTKNKALVSSIKSKATITPYQQLTKQQAKKSLHKEANLKLDTEIPLKRKAHYR
ncbi:hypothetical protein [Candidatus Berkiella aquae]|uniref:Uncharacterized protein n=1 Tax=Candidatus Berkiella aquae TaxID=295108 RepID=A0A0Q9YPQ2_9GAMM|nr:hypothetical protein [Candidatus Berkiella aquae]MCS5711949.1 hypothetical protein [Candidatus Berkiella aquae]